VQCQAAYLKQRLGLTADFCTRCSDYGLKSQTPNLQITKKSQHGNLIVIGYWSFFGVWTFAIWDFQRTGYPIAVQKSAV
jgi:hypothetical protein